MARKRPESVLVVVHTRAGEVLLLRRAEPPDFWQSVTGSLEPAETPVQAARREVREETGLSPEGLVDCDRRRRFPILPAWRARYGPKVRHNLEHHFRLPLPGRGAVRVNPREHVEHRWLARADAVDRATSWTDRAAIRALPAPPSGATVVLIHGLWLGPHSMRLLARRLRAAGFRTAIFGYRATRVPAPEAARRLARFVGQLDAPVIHFVAHSLGGIVLAHLLQAERPGRFGRSVLLGSPLRGSAAARAMQARRLGCLLGAARRGGLDGAGPGWPREMPLATVGGTIACGPVRPLLRLPAPHDGTVALRETRVPGARHATVRATHVGLLTSRRAAAAVIGLLGAGAEGAAGSLPRQSPGD